MKIAQAAQCAGLSAYTIRFYEKAGLLPLIDRGADGHRRFSQENIDWLVLLASLRETGMPLRKMKEFAGLYRRGAETVPDRKTALRAHEAQLAVQEAKLAKCKAILARKVALYDEMLGEMG